MQWKFTLCALLLVLLLVDLSDAGPTPRRPRRPRKRRPLPKKHFPPLPKKHLPPIPKKHRPLPIPKYHAPPHLPKFPAPKYVPPKYTPPCQLLPGNFPYGNYNHYSGYTQFHCNSGYLISGHAQLSCVNNAWNYPIPTCNRQRCVYRRPSNIGMNLYAKHPTNNYYQNDHLYFGCHNGWNLQGTAYQTCRGGKFDGPYPRCVQPTKKYGPPIYNHGYLPFLNKY